MKLLWAAAAFAVFISGCGSDSPTLILPDAGDAPWGQWPPREGTAGIELQWTVDGEVPTATSCGQVDLDLVQLLLTHHVNQSATWTDDALIAACEQGVLRLEPEDGVAPGKYRFRVGLFHEDGSSFQQAPAGEAVLEEGIINLVATVNITQAQPN